MKLAAKSVVPYLIILFIASILFSFSLYKSRSYKISSELIQNAKKNAHRMAKKVAKAHPNATMHDYEKILNEYINYPYTAYAVVFSLDRNINLPVFKDEYNIPALRYKLFSIKNVKDYRFEKNIDLANGETILEISVPVIVSKTYYKELSSKQNLLVLSEKETKKYDFPEFVDQMVYIVKYAITLKDLQRLTIKDIKNVVLYFITLTVFFLALIYKYEERLLNPILKLISLTKNISHETRLRGHKIERTDELGQLSENIFTMHEKSLNSINNLYLSNEYAQSLISSPSISSLLNTIIFDLIKLKGIEKGGLLYWNEKRERFAIKETKSFNDIHKKIANDKDFINWFLSNRTILDPENFLKNFENYNHEEISRWHALGVELIIPMILHEKVVGFINLGKLTKKARYSDEDKKFFNSLSQIAVMAVENLNLRLRQAQNIIIKKDLDFARDVQAKLLPDKMPLLKGTEFAISTSPARNIGGDYYDFIRLVDGTIGIVIADVSGKGVSAALVMASTRSYLRLIAKDNFDCKNVLSNLNELLIADTNKKMFVTMFYSILDMNNYELDFSNAGHNFPIIYKHRTRRSIYIQANGFPLGVMDNFNYETSEISIEKGDMIVYYTDGIIEAINENKELFGFARLEEMINRYGELGATEFLDVFMEDFNKFIGDEELADDYTIIAVKIS